MNIKKHMFCDKIYIIYNNLCKKDLNYLTKLFYIRTNKATFENRKVYIRTNWLKKQDIAFMPRMFKSEYFKYQFSKLTINGRPLFIDGEEFLTIDIEQFHQRIKNYLALQVEIDIEQEKLYRYLYIYNINGVEDRKNIDYYEIEYLSSTTSNEIKIDVIPPKHKSSLDIQSYHGQIRYQESKIILTFENSDDYISAIFNTDLSSRHTPYLVGVGSGIADINQKIAVAKKVIFSKEKIEDSNTLYPILNETETISAIENSYDIKYTDRDFKAKHLHKYIDKIDRLNLLFTKLSKEEYYNSFYEQLAFKEFKATRNIFKKIKKRQPYYVEYRKRVIDILLKTYPHEKYQKIYMVMPTYKEDNIFAQETSKALTLQKELIELSHHVEIEIIFVVESCKEPLVYEFEKFLEMAKSHIKISFTLKKRVEYEVNSIDFILTDKNNFVITKFLRDSAPLFRLYEDRETIEGHEAIYRKIRNRSISCEEFLKDKNRLCIQSNSTLKALTGEWYHYTYGSKKFWVDRVVIHQTGKVEYYSEGKLTEEGEIIVKKYQSILLLSHPINKRLFTMIFDHQPYQIQKAFFTKNIGKQIEKNLDMFALGILSRKKMSIKKAKEILGSFEDVTFLEDSKMSERLGDYLAETYGNKD